MSKDRLALSAVTYHTIFLIHDDVNQALNRLHESDRVLQLPWKVAMTINFIQLSVMSQWQGGSYENEVFAEMIGLNVSKGKLWFAVDSLWAWFNKEHIFFFWSINQYPNREPKIDVCQRSVGLRKFKLNSSETRKVIS